MSKSNKQNILKRSAALSSEEQPQQKKQNVSTETKKQVSISGLMSSYNDSSRNFFVGRCVRPSLENRKVRDSTTKLFTCSFEDENGSIPFSCWGETAEYYAKMLKDRQVYEISNFSVTATSDWERNNGSGMKKLSKKDNSMDISTSSKTFGAGAVTLQTLCSLSLASPKPPVASIVAMVTKHSPPISGLSKTNSKYVFSKVTLEDHSGHDIELTVWGESDNEVRYSPGQIVVVVGTKVAKTFNKNADAPVTWSISGGAITVLDCAAPQFKSPLIDQIVQWKQLGGGSSCPVQHISGGNDFRSGAAFKGERISSLQIKAWESECQSLIDHYRAENHIDEVKYDTPVPPELCSQFPSGYFHIVGEITSIGECSKNPIMYPSCAAKSDKHKGNPRVEFKSGSWFCSKCQASLDHCNYSIIANVVINDELGPITIKTFSLEGLGGGTDAYENIMASIRKTTGLAADPEDYVTFNNQVVADINKMVDASPKSSLIQVNFQIVPDWNSGIYLRMVSMTDVDLEKEIEYNNNYINAMN